MEDHLSRLRKKAEKALQGRPIDKLDLAELSNQEIYGLLHELQVHQIELEMQNEGTKFLIQFKEPSHGGEGYSETRDQNTDL